MVIMIYDTQIIMLFVSIFSLMAMKMSGLAHGSWINQPVVCQIRLVSVAFLMRRLFLCASYFGQQ